MKKKNIELLRIAVFPTLFVAVLLFWFLGDLLFPELKTTGTSDIFLKAGFVAAFVIMIIIIIYTKFPKQKFVDIIVKTWERTTVRNVSMGLIGGFVLGALANAQNFSIGQYSVIPLFTAATAPLLGVYSYILNAPIEDVLFIATPRLFIGVLAATRIIKFDPFVGSDIERRIAVFTLTGALAMIAHAVSRGGANWMLDPLSAMDPGVFLFFGLLGLIAKEYGFFTADALHMGVNAGLVTTAFTIVV